MLAALTLIALASAPAEPPLAEVLAQAAADGKPVFLDVYTSWCQPCRQLEAQVLSTPEVKRALKSYRAQRYNAEKGHGVEVANRYGVSSYPTLLIVNPDGVEIARPRQYSVEGLVRALDEFRPPGAARGRYAEGEPFGLKAAVEVRLDAAREKDPAYLLVGGILSERVGRSVEARALYDRAEALDPGDARGVASRAAFRKLRQDLSGTYVRNRGALLLAFARKYPRGELAGRAVASIVELAPAQRPPSAEIRPVCAAVLQGLTARKDHLALDGLSWSLLRLDFADLALEAARTAESVSPYQLDHVVAEAAALQATGHGTEAVALLHKGLKVDPGNGLVSWARARAEQGQPFLRDRETLLFSE